MEKLKIEILTYKMTLYCKILKDTHPLTKFPKYYEYKLPCLRNMKPPI